MRFEVDPESQEGNFFLNRTVVTACPVPSHVRSAGFDPTGRVVPGFEAAMRLNSCRVEQMVMLSESGWARRCPERHLFWF